MELTSIIEKLCKQRDELNSIIASLKQHDPPCKE
jgi:hypothetical protein